jgi:hypothetical protein
VGRFSARLPDAFAAGLEVSVIFSDSPIHTDTVSGCIVVRAAAAKFPVSWSRSISSRKRAPNATDGALRVVLAPIEPSIDEALDPSQRGPEHARSSQGRDRDRERWKGPSRRCRGPRAPRHTGG